MKSGKVLFCPLAENLENPPPPHGGLPHPSFLPFSAFSCVFLAISAKCPPPHLKNQVGNPVGNGILLPWLLAVNMIFMYHHMWMLPARLLEL